MISGLHAQKLEQNHDSSEDEDHFEGSALLSRRGDVSYQFTLLIRRRRGLLDEGVEFRDAGGRDLELKGIADDLQILFIRNEVLFELLLLAGVVFVLELF